MRSFSGRTGAGEPDAGEASAGLRDPICGAQPRTHVLGLHPFSARQIDYGIGYVHDPDGLHLHYWVIIATEPLH